MAEETNKKCMFCKRTEEETPLLQVDFKSIQYWICPQHIPILIHDPQKLIGILPDAENLKAG